MCFGGGRGYCNDSEQPARPIEVTSLNSSSQRRVEVPASARLSISSYSDVRKRRGCASSLSSSSSSSGYVRNRVDWNTRSNIERRVHKWEETEKGPQKPTESDMYHKRRST